MAFSPTSAAVVFTLGALSATALGLAYVAQYGFGLEPCELCLAQRLPYMATLFLGLMALMPAVPPAARRQVVWLCAALFAVNAGIALYHAGVEYHWWPGPTACTGSVRTYAVSDLLAALNRPGRVSCDVPAIRVWGISMAGANVAVSAALAGACALAATRLKIWAAP